MIEVLYRCEVCQSECRRGYLTFAEAPESIPCCANIVPQPAEDEEQICLYSMRKIL